MKLVIVTGMSGAGKTVALKMLEDMGYYCVDNLPIPLVEKFAQLVLDSQGKSSHVALGIDIRSGEDLSMLDGILDSWKTEAVPFEILFLDAGDQVQPSSVRKRKGGPGNPQRAGEAGFFKEKGRHYH